MKQLLDTHALLWFLQGAEEARPVRAIIERGENFVSSASLWEAALKVSLGKLSLPYDIAELPTFCSENGFELLSIGAAEAIAVAKLPFHHRDPFDRLLVAQALEHGLPLISRDPRLGAYGVRVVWG